MIPMISHKNQWMNYSIFQADNFENYKNQVNRPAPSVELPKDVYDTNHLNVFLNFTRQLESRWFRLLDLNS